ncbi:MAG TPA: CotH kinase family protein, partial [Verrucomicrobiae bacterium]
AVITGAQLSLLVVRQPNTGFQNSTFSLRRLLQAWAQGAQIPGEGGPGIGASALPGEATWNNRFSGGTLWAQPGGQAGVDFSATISSLAFVGGTGDEIIFASGPALIADVQSWLDNPASNFGWMLKTESEAVGKTARSFASRESGFGPTLTLSYTVVPEPSAFALAGLFLVCFGAIARRRSPNRPVKVRTLFLVVWLVCSASVFAADKNQLTKASKATAKSPKPKKVDSSDALFATNAPILTFNIEVAGGELAALQRDDRAYARGTVSIGTNVLRDVAFRLKGNGSRRPLNEKPSFVAKFDHYVPDQKFDGLTKIALNNSSQDPTFLADFIANAMFADANVPVSRVTHARVTFNGRDLGLYVLVEMHNKEFLKRWFHNADGNLYEAYLQDIDQQIDLDNGNDKAQSDRKKFAEVVKIADATERWTKLHDVLDVDRYVSHLVCELFTSHTDGYAMNRNNYRIYHNPDTDRFTFIGHGVDWAFGNTGVSMQPPQNSLVTKAVMTTPEGAKLFRERRLDLFTNIFQLDVVTNRVNAAVGRLVSQAKNPNEAKDFLRYGVDMNNRLVGRWQNITNQIYAPPPIPAEFDNKGIARLTGWHTKTDKNSAPVTHDRGVDDSRHVLHIIATNGPAVASWRTRVQLPAGIYSFEGYARGAGIVTRTNANEAGVGAGLRVSQGKRQNKLEGDASWRQVQYSLTNTVEDSVEFVCELRATKGEVFFDEDSLRLVKRHD